MADDIPGQLSFDLGLEADEAETHADHIERTYQLDAIRARNAKLVEELAALGRRPDPAGVMMMRLSALVDFLLDETARTEFELAFETNMSALLGQWVTQARQMALLPIPAQRAPAGDQAAQGGGLFISR